MAAEIFIFLGYELCVIFRWSIFSECILVVEFVRVISKATKLGRTH